MRVGIRPGFDPAHPPSGELSFSEDALVGQHRANNYNFIAEAAAKAKKEARFKLTPAEETALHDAQLELSFLHPGRHRNHTRMKQLNGIVTDLLGKKHARAALRGTIDDVISETVDAKVQSAIDALPAPTTPSSATLPAYVTTKATDASQIARGILRKKKGRSALITTTPRGVLNPAPVRKQTLGGA